MNQKDDLISRQEAIDALDEAFPDETNTELKDGMALGLARAIVMLKELPAAEPERKTGRWELSGEWLYICSRCGARHYFTPYCPMCGVKMGDRNEQPGIQS